MLSVMTGVGIAMVMLCIALFKGRTGWHWFLLSLIAFATIWLLSIAALYIANVHPTLQVADRFLAGFAGAVTCIVVVVLLVAVPYRPRRHSSVDAAPRRRSEP